MSKNLRNIAIIAHVDHGKTTLVDALLKQTHTFRDNQEEMGKTCLLDSNDLERERGITILAKNTSVDYQGVKINIIDTPGHADFSGEVERTLNMADGAILIVDAQEGPMPQTRFVLKKALEQKLKIIVVINKIDKQFANIPQTIERINDLFLDLATDESQLEFPILYAVGRDGKVYQTPPTTDQSEGDVTPLLDYIIKYIPSPQADINLPFKMLISALDYNPHLGKICIGKISQGQIKLKQKFVLSNRPHHSFSVDSIMLFHGLSRQSVEEASAGDIVALSGLPEVNIGETVTDPVDLNPLPSIKLSDPTLHLTIGPNTSPFSGQDGQFSTAKQLESRLEKELETNLSLKLKKLENGRFQISGRGELHLAILLESLRREGYEFEVAKPQVITKLIDNLKQEPVEEINLIVPQIYLGTINKELGQRQAHLLQMSPLSSGDIEFIYHLSTRNLLGLRSLLLTATKGTIIMNSQVIEYQPFANPLPKLRRGVLIAAETGQALAYGLQNAQGRGQTFIDAGIPVYEGMIIGQNSRDEDLQINVTKGKKLTNMRSKASDGIIKLEPPIKFSLEQALDFLEDDELLEITPLNLRLRKKYLTDIERRRQRRS